MSDVYRAPSAAGSAGLATGSIAETYGEEAGSGWVLFAGVMIMIVGVMNVVHGVAAIDRSSFYVEDANYIVFNELDLWY